MCYTFWHWLKKPTWDRVFVSGVALGLAELAKTTFIIFYLVWPLIWVCYRWPQRQVMTGRDWSRQCAMLVALMILCIYVINFGYGFEGSGTRLGEFKFVSKTLAGADAGSETGGNRFAGSLLESLPVPFPRNYVIGIDVQKRDFEHYGQPSYLHNEFRWTGWWYYYLYAVGVKVPLGTWCLLGLALATGIIVRRDGRRARARHEADVGGGGTAAGDANPDALPTFDESQANRDEAVLLIPAAILFAFVSSQSGMGQHMRLRLAGLPVPVRLVRSRVAALGSQPPVVRRADDSGALVVGREQHVGLST